MAGINVMKLFTVIIIVQLFYSFSITVLTHSLPDGSLNYVGAFSEPADEISLTETATSIEDSISRQTSLPIVEFGALVFFSGNIVVDLLLNFAFAIPQMIGILINGIMLLFNVDSFLFATVQVFSSVVIMALYFFGLIQLVLGVRSGSSGGLV